MQVFIFWLKDSHEYKDAELESLFQILILISHNDQYHFRQSDWVHFLTHSDEHQSLRGTLRPPVPFRPRPHSRTLVASHC